MTSLRALLEGASEKKLMLSNANIKVSSLDEILSISDESDESAAIVEDLIYNGDFVLLSAISKTGKSLLSTQLALSVASGAPFLGKNTFAKKVLYVQVEVTERNLKKRIASQIENTPLEKSDDNILFCNNYRFRLDSPEGFREFKEVVDVCQPNLIIVDPFYCLHDGPENESSHIAPILTELNVLTKNRDMALVLIHHEGKKSEGGAGQTVHRSRGSSSFGDVPDALWSFKKAGDKFVLSIEMRNRQSPDPITLLRSDTLWHSLDGESAPEFKWQSLFGDSLSMSRRDLSSKFQRKYSLSDTTFEREVKKAINSNILEKEKFGKEVSYKLVVDSCHLSGPIGDDK